MSSSGIKFNRNENSYDIILNAGKTIGFSLTWGGKSPIDVTGYSSRLVIKKSPQLDAAAEFTVANGRVVIGSSDGLISFSADSSDTVSWSAGNYVYELMVTDAGGNDISVLTGLCRIVKGIA